VTAIFDRVEDLVTVISPVWPGSDRSAAAAYELACERLAEVTADFERSLPYRRERREDSADLPEPSSNISRDDFHAMVHKAKDYIAAGDVYQVVLAQRFSVPFTLPPFMLYRALRRLNPSPFLFYLDFGDF